LEDAKREEEREEVPVVATSETVVDPGAVVVAFRYAVATEAAVFGASGFEEVAG